MKQTIKKVLKRFFQVGGICFLYILSLPPLIFYGLILSGLELPGPEPMISHGEFPVRLTYEINGEEKIIEDVIIFDYDYRADVWNEYFKSGRDRFCLIDLRKSVAEFEERERTVLVHFDCGSYKNYMGYHNEPVGTDGVYCATALKHFEYPADISWWNNMSADEALEKYGLRIKSFEYSPPIENEFVRFPRIRKILRSWFSRDN